MLADFLFKGPTTGAWRGLLLLQIGRRTPGNRCYDGNGQIVGYFKPFWVLSVRGGFAFGVSPKTQLLS